MVQPTGSSASGRSTTRAGAPPRLRMMPFVVAGVAGVLVALTGVQRPGFALVAAVFAVAVAVAAVALPWHRLPGWAPVLLSLAIVATVGLLLVGVGGEPFGTVALVLLPVFWLALFGSAAELTVVLAAVPFAVALPALVPDAEVGLGQALASALVVTLVAASVGFATHHLVGEVRQHRRAETAGRRRLRRILDTSGDTAVLMWSPDGRITGMNQGAQELFGVREDVATAQLAPADLLGAEAMRTLTAALGYGNPADPDAVGDGMLLGDRWTREDRAVSGVTTRVGTGGAAVWARLDLGAVTDDLGRAVEYVLVAHDITDLQETQQDLEAARRDLATVVEVLHEAQAGRDVRSTVCRQTRQLAGADATAILEARDGLLTVTTHDGLDLGGVSLSLDPPDSAAALAFVTGRRLEIDDARSDPRVSTDVVRGLGLGSLLHEPIRQDGVVVAVLSVAWRAAGVAVSPRVSESVSALAGEAGLAMRRENAVRRLESHARLDPLTGLPNRRAWDVEVDVHVRSGTDAATPAPPQTAGQVCLAMLDIDHFKRLNDRQGHQSGDALLRNAAGAWRRQLRATDFLARYGGEEFGVLLPGCGLDEARLVLERLRAATPDPVTVSVGLAEWDGHETSHSLVGRADAALYAAKHAGRDRLVVAEATPEPAEPADPDNPDDSGAAPAQPPVSRREISSPSASSDPPSSSGAVRSTSRSR